MATATSQATGLLRVDLHIHTSFSPDGATAPRDVVRRCEEVGLSCVAITDHNTIAGALEACDVSPIPIIIGEEVMTSDGEVIGLFLKREIPRGLSPTDTMRAIREQGGLVCIPHPFDRFRSGLLRRVEPDGLLPLIDIIEVYNARTFYPPDNRSARRFAEEHRLLVCAASDAHTPEELGHTFVEMPQFDGTAKGFMKALRNARLVTQRGNPAYRLRSAYTKLRRFLGHA